MKNTILLAMSTLPGNPRIDNWFFEGQNLGLCISQLEPVVKAMLSKEGKEQLDMIILCSKETIQDDYTFKFGVSKNSTELTEEEKYCNELTKDQPITAINFFINRMNQHYDTINNQSNILTNYILKDTNNIQKVEYKGLKYTIIPFAESEQVVEGQDDLFQSIQRVINVIKEDYTAKPFTNFWVDTHGSFRDLSLIINAILSILKRDSIIPNEVYGTDTYNHIVKSQKRSFNMFDFVSAMNEFLNYGSSKGLHSFYEGNDDLKELLEAMDLVSEGTQQCDPKKYTKGLKQLSRTIKTTKSNDTMFSIFKSYIEQDYGDLVYEDKQTPTRIIRRCVDKSMYQQALTFIESLMPKEFIKHDLLTYTINGNIDELKQANAKAYLDDESFIAEQYILTYWYFFRRDCYTDEEKDSQSLELIRLCSRRNVNIASNHFDNRDLRRKNVNCTVHVESFLQSNKANKFGQVCRLHKALKRIRNQYNHTNGHVDRPSNDELEKAINYYIDLCEAIFG